MKRVVILMAATSLLFPACGDSETELEGTTSVVETSMDEPPIGTTSAEDSMNLQTFIEKAATDSLMEVQLGQMAQDKTQSDDVRSFGQMMVADHTRTNEKLKPIAQQLGVTVPSELTPEQQQKVDRLSGLSGEEFDREYVKMMVEDHQKAVQLFERAAGSGLPPPLGQFATDTLPTLQMHLDHARKLQGAATVGVSV